MCWAGPESEKPILTQKPKNERRAQKQGRAVSESWESTFVRLGTWGPGAWGVGARAREARARGKSRPALYSSTCAQYDMVFTHRAQRRCLYSLVQLQLDLSYEFPTNVQPSSGWFRRRFRRRL